MFLQEDKVKLRLVIDRKMAFLATIEQGTTHTDLHGCKVSVSIVSKMASFPVPTLKIFFLDFLKKK